MTAAAHDTTGGMEAKISEAAMIAKLGIDVYIVKVSMFSHVDLYALLLMFSLVFAILIFSTLNRQQPATH